MTALINILILVLIFLVIWKVIEFALAKFGYPISGPIAQILGLIFLLILLIQIFGILGYGSAPFVIVR